MRPMGSPCHGPPFHCAIAVNDQQRNLSQSLYQNKNKRRISEVVGSLILYFFSHLSVVQMAVIQCVNVCLLFSFYCMHFDFSPSSVFPSHVAQKIKQGAPNYLLFGLIKFSCSALCWWECVDDERWWDFPFFPHLFRKSSPLERSQVTSVLRNLPKLSQSVFGATVDTSGRAHLLNFSFVHFPPSSLMMILWLPPVPFPPLMFSVGASPGLLSWLPLDSTWMTSSSPLVFNDHLYEQYSLVAQKVKRLPATWETWVWSLGQEDPLEKEMATHSSTHFQYPGKSHGWRSLVGYSPWSHKESDITKRLHLPEHPLHPQLHHSSSLEPRPWYPAACQRVPLVAPKSIHSHMFHLFRLFLLSQGN